MTGFAPPEDAAFINAQNYLDFVLSLFTAIATPAADIVSMFLLALPMVALYFAAYGIAYLHDRRTLKCLLTPDEEVAP